MLLISIDMTHLLIAFDLALMTYMMKSIISKCLRHAGVILMVILHGAHVVRGRGLRCRFRCVVSSMFLRPRG